MKVLEFETSKGKFKLIDMPETIRINGWNGSIMIDEVNQISQEKYSKGFYLKNITEEQASEIVDSDDEYGVVMYQNYQTTSMQYFDEQITAIESLHSLLKSKGVNLFRNPYLDYETLDIGAIEAEEKTFKTPYIFKL